MLFIPFLGKTVLSTNVTHLYPFLSLASVSAHYVPTVCNGREIVDSTTSSLWPLTVLLFRPAPATVSQSMNSVPLSRNFPTSHTHTVYTHSYTKTYTHMYMYTKIHAQTNTQPSLWTRTVLFHKCRKCVTIIKLFSRDVHTWNRHCCK